MNKHYELNSKGSKGTFILIWFCRRIQKGFITKLKKGLQVKRGNNGFIDLCKIMRNHKRLNPDPGAALQAKASDGLKIIVDPHHWFLPVLINSILF